MADTGRIAAPVQPINLARSASKWPMSCFILVRLADRLGIDLAASAFDKIAINAKKYPVALSKGSSKKYTEL